MINFAKKLVWGGGIFNKILYLNILLDLEGFSNTGKVEGEKIHKVAVRVVRCRVKDRLTVRCGVKGGLTEH